MRILQTQFYPRQFDVVRLPLEQGPERLKFLTLAQSNRPETHLRPSPTDCCKNGQ
jgi:hypothetical protein